MNTIKEVIGLAILTYSITVGQMIKSLATHDLIVTVSPQADFDQMTALHVTYDSREVKEGSLFICKGFGFKPEYLTAAVANGAVAYITQDQQLVNSTKLPYILVTDVRRAMAVVALELYHHCYQQLTLVGLTGTKGKTTTTYFIHNILNSYLGRKTGILSTIEMYTGRDAIEAHLTTPESLDLHKLFEDAVSNGITHLTMEVSSQAYKMERVYGMSFDYGMFLNIGEDHIGPLEHIDFEDYFGCKLEFVKNCRTMVVNGTMDRADIVKSTAEKHCQKVITYGLDPKCDYYAANIVPTAGGFCFDVISKAYKQNFCTKMAGRFNVENAVGAIALAKSMGIDDASICEGIKNTSVMGRMNVFNGKDVTVIVDYAHNKLSFTRLYESLKADYPSRRLVSLFGCPGGKAQLRRRDIGTLSGQYADFIYLTAEDPQFESVRDICNEIHSFIAPYDVPCEIIEDREEAIKKAILCAQPGDVILLAAKGEELYQKVKGQYQYYESDYKLAEKYIAIRDNGVHL